MKFLAHGILTNNNLNNRDLRLDFWRGIGCIGVIALHTAYYSGDGYTPVWFKSMLMVVDVPLFFFCSGWGSNYGTRNVFKVFKSIGMIWLKWIFFVSILAVIRLFLSQNWIGFDSLFSAYLFKASSKYFPVLSDSIWFMPYYFAVVFVNSFVTILLKSNDEYKKLYCIFLIVVYLGLVYDYNFFNLNITFIFYSFFWILGNILYKKRISGRSLILGVIVLLFGYFFWGNYIQHIAIDNLQANKFPPQPLYLIASLFIILCILYYRRGGGVLVSYYAYWRKRHFLFYGSRNWQRHHVLHCSVFL